MQTLKTLREIVEQEHTLRVERAASLPAFTFATASSTGARVVVLHGDAEATGFAPRDAVELGAPGGEAVAAGTIVAVDAESVVVELLGTRQPTLPEPGQMRLRVDENQRTIRLRAIERVVRERHNLRWVGPLLTSQAPAPLDTSLGPTSDHASLTPGQARALAGATAAADVFLIQGPPGTGKTTVIAELVRGLAHARGARVLLSAASHRAIDNALERIESLDLQALRLGQSARVTGAGQTRLLSELARRADEEITPRQTAVQAVVDTLQQALAETEQSLVRLEYLRAAIVAGDAAIAERLADIDRWLVHALHEVRTRQAADDAAAHARNPLWARLTRMLGAGDRDARYRKAANQLGSRRRTLLGRADLVQLRQHVAELHDELEQLTAHFPSALPTNAIGLPVPTISLSNDEAIRASLDDVRRAAAQLERAIPALQAWWMLVDQPGGLARFVVANADVVAATAIGVDSGRDGARIAELDFDVAVIDEASQAPLTDLVVPLSRARSVILVGDHRQLPPYVDEELRQRCTDAGIDASWFDSSVFEQLWDRVPASHRTRLDVQFRMPAAIADFLGDAFYEGDLASAPSRRGTSGIGAPFNAAVVFVDTSDEPRREETDAGQGFRNRCEAELVALVSRAVPEELSFGVIAPYAAQVSLLRQTLASARGLPTRDPWLVDNVATVDSFQGQERDVIVVSLTRSNRAGAIGFLSDLKRLNVTLSRAREQLVIVGDLDTLRLLQGGEPRQAFAAFLRDLVEHLKVHGEVVPSLELRARVLANA